MTAKLNMLEQQLRKSLGDAIRELKVACGEITLVVDEREYHATMAFLRDNQALRFEELMDLCGVDFSEYANGEWKQERFALVIHLLSLANNWRLRVRVFAADDTAPKLPSIADIWPAANWYEREAFDLFGIEFQSHPDLRRILTDYDFAGHPFRKDFPLSGYVEMRYDEQHKRVVYQPVTIEPQELTPRVIREKNYGVP